jgi:hypothetical protein
VERDSSSNSIVWRHPSKSGRRQKVRRDDHAVCSKAVNAQQWTPSTVRHHHALHMHACAPPSRAWLISLASS